MAESITLTADQLIELVKAIVDGRINIARGGEPPKLVNASQLAKRLGTTPGTILAWYREGKIPAEVAEGSMYRFNADQVVALLRQRAGGEEPEKGLGKKKRWTWNY